MAKGNDRSYRRMTAAAFVEALSRPAPTPAGGSAAALTGAMGAALAAMVAAIAKAEPQSHEAREIQQRLLEKVDEDAKAYEDVMRARRGGDPEAMRSAYRRASLVPLEVVALSVAAARLCARLKSAVKPEIASDLATGGYLARAAARAAAHTVRTNLPHAGDEALAGKLEALLSEIEQMERDAEES